MNFLDGRDLSGLDKQSVIHWRNGDEVARPREEDGDSRSRWMVYELFIYLWVQNGDSRSRWTLYELFIW